MFKKLMPLVVMILAVIYSPVSAQDEDKVIIHGFGSWAYGSTDGNNYLFATEDGTWDFWDVALNINALPMDDLRINVQLYAGSTNKDVNVKVDFAFVEYSFTDEFNFRAGKVKHPFGNYGEILKASTLRPFMTLPSIYQSAFFVSDGYTGVGLVGNTYPTDDFGINYHFFAGKFEGIINRYDTTTIIMEAIYGMPNPGALPDFFGPRDTETKDVIGANVVFETPIDGLNLGVSGFHGDFSFYESGQLLESTNNVIGGSMDYTNDPYQIRGEYVYSKLDDFNVEVKVYYIEAAYNVTENIQPAFRYCSTAIDDPNPNIDVVLFPSLNEETELSLGLNYIVNSGFIIRGSWTKVEGNQKANPADGLLSFINRTLEEDTNVFMLGTSFSF
jgi:hypothetical protein